MNGAFEARLRGPSLRPLWLVAAVGLLACGTSDDTAPRDHGALGGPVVGTPDATGTAGNGPVADDGNVGQPGPQAPPAPAGDFCNVSALSENHCQACHGEALVGGAPMRLVTHGDFMAPTPSNPGVPVYETALARMNDTRMPMPPGQQNMVPAAELAAFDAWIAAGTPAPATACASNADPNPPMPPEPTPPAGDETCYDLLSHGGQTPGDTTPYMVQEGENYEQFYFTAPWTEPVLATRFGADFDNLPVLHHWLLFTSGKAASLDGTHETVIGTQIGDTAQLLAGWAVGGEDVTMPADVGLELPAPGTLLNVQWHYFNATGAAQPDSSAVQVCTVPVGGRANVASITWLGTENFNGFIGMPPGFVGDYEGTCVNDSGGPITIFFFWPHMHEIGRNMRSVVRRVDGTVEEVFNMPFDFNYQIVYDANVVLQPGDSITSTCSFENNTLMNVAFGPSTKQEMCYQFAFSYPARALDNGVPSLIGATNTCW